MQKTPDPDITRESSFGYVYSLPHNPKRKRFIARIRWPLANMRKPRPAQKSFPTRRAAHIWLCQMYYR